MEKNKNTVEEALLQIRNLEEALQENVKGVLRSTMKEEIKELVKESLNEQAEVEDEEEFEIEGGDDDINAGEEVEFEDDEVESDEFEDDELEGDEFEDDEFEDDEFEDDETVDLTGASDDEVLKVFKAMGDEDGIIVKREDDMIHLEDGEDEYLVQLGESYMEEDADLTMSDFELGEGNTDTLYEIEFEDEDEFEDEESEYDGLEIGDNMPSYKTKYSMPSDEEDDDEESIYNQLKNYPEVGNMYIDDFPDEMEEEDHMGSLEDQIMEALKSKMKPKGEGIGHGPKFNYDKKPNMGGGFNEKRKEAFGKGTKAVGTGKAKFEYKEEKEFGSKKHEYKRKEVDGVKKKAGEDKDGHYKDYEKSETKEAVRTNSYPRANKVGNRKGSNQNVNRQEIRVRPNTRSVNEEVEMLRERNEEYKKALDLFRTKLNEVAIFNSNLAYATRLFTEHSTTKQEKINILRRFDEVESLKESKNLYRSMKGELTNTTSNEKTITESIEKTVRTPASGSAANLIESKTYENPQFLRMKDLMSKIN
jgi:hypothetical protein